LLPHYTEPALNERSRAARRIPLASLILLPAASVVLVLAFVLGFFRVQQNSMLPTIRPGSCVVELRAALGLRAPLASGYLFRWGSPSRGAIVVFRSPLDGTNVIKRCVGLPGDSLSYREPGVLEVGGRILPVTALQASRFASLSAVPAGFLFVAGDNEAESLDSREYGLVPIEGIDGVVLCWF
jgi:signal peptidase I